MKIIKAARIVTLITGLVIAGMFFSSPVSARTFREPGMENFPFPPVH